MIGIIGRIQILVIARIVACTIACISRHIRSLFEVNKEFVAMYLSITDMVSRREFLVNPHSFDAKQ
jgi:hypothetical protein